MNKERILVVEDSETQALRICHLLENADFEVDCAAKADTALNKLNHELPDLLITDYHLPGITGDELCRRIRMNVNTRGIPILMLTSDENTQAEQQGLESGADDYVWKSVADEILLIRVQTLLKKSHLQSIVAPEQERFIASRILVVDDSPTYQQYVAMELQRAGYQVDTASSGKEALEKLALLTFDGVVLDMILPDMSHVEMCRSFVRARRTLDHNFVLLMLTGGEDQEEMNAVLAAGADDVVGKSKDIKIIKARLGALIRRKQLYEENQRIINEFREREIVLLRTRAEKEAAEERAALADQLAQTNRELRETQSQLVQSAKMASLGELVAGVAHEINNPLAFVISHLTTIKDGISGVLPEIESDLSDKSRSRMNKLQQRIQDMQSGLERIKDLVIKLRTFSRLDEGEFKQVNIKECIESVLTLLQYRFDDRISVIRKYGNDNVINCYPGPFNQVIMNIISNAIDAIEKQGEITIITDKVDSVFTVTVTDTGIGIPEDIRDRIFEPFFTTKSTGQGTGLGLSISYGIVKKHHGEITVESEIGKGTKMNITIPCK